MTPGHGHEANNSPAPYRLTVARDDGDDDDDDGAASSVFRVELAAASETGYFIGFLVEARVSGTGGDRDAVGSFREWMPDDQSVGTADFKTLDCNGAPVSVS